MATMIDGESYLGKVLVRPLDKSGDVTMYLWPVRCLKSKMGGPTSVSYTHLPLPTNREV